VKFPKTPILGACLGFSSGQAKRAKSKIVHIIETTAPISTKFYITIKTTPSNTLRWWSKHAQKDSKMADGRRIEKKVNRHISTTV